jgi:nitrate/nitrite-specific signal transduction histidine kinase
MRQRSGQESAGHWGLTGLRERAKLMGGHLDVWSELESGTEVELTIPASIAYACISTLADASDYSPTERK